MKIKYYTKEEAEAEVRKYAHLIEGKAEKVGESNVSHRIRVGLGRVTLSGPLPLCLAVAELASHGIELCLTGVVTWTSSYEEEGYGPEAIRRRQNAKPGWMRGQDRICGHEPVT